MSGPITTFQTAKWHRISIDYPVETRPCRIEDMEGIKVTLAGNMTDFSGDEFKNAMNLPNVWKAKYPHWQQALDCFIMQKSNTTITLKKTCSADSADRQEVMIDIPLATSLEYYFGETQSRTVPYVTGDVTSAADYVIESTRLEDHANSTCSIELKLKQHGTWSRVKRNFNATTS